MFLFNNVAFTTTVVSIISCCIFWTKSLASQPHILLLLVDDLGWSDVGYHGSQIKTPNVDRLAREGVILENYYVQQYCTPTRGSLMTGRYPIHTGLQHRAILSLTPFGLPLEFSILPEKLKEVGYKTHLVGKWHLGHYTSVSTPTHRGFDSFFGFYNYGHDHFNHTHDGFLDLFEGEKVARGYKGQYTSHLYVQEVERIVEEHNSSKPLFLYMAFENVHDPIQAPEKYLNKYSFIKDRDRRTYAAMMDVVDEAIGNITKAFREKGLWNDTLVIFSSDNGGDPFYRGFNYPLRGYKKTLWEGGVKACGFVHGQMLKRKGVISRDLIHVTDWYPTLINLAGATLDSKPMPVDGFDVWETISSGTPSPRTELLHNIDFPEKRPGLLLTYDTWYSGAAIRVGDMKLLMHVPNATWYQVPEEGGIAPDMEEIWDQKTNIVELALYNITADPTDRYDVSHKYPNIVRHLKDRIHEHWKTAVPPGIVPDDIMALAVAIKNKAWVSWRDTCNAK